jgi:hypothetical protein
MEGKRKISREKGVEICGDRMYAGIKPKEIIRELGEDYGVSVSTVEKWMKAARPAVAERQAAANAIRERVDKEETEASAKRLHITKERLMEELAKVAFYDPRKMYNVDGGLRPIHEWDDETAGAIGTVESFDVKTDVKEEDEVVDSVTTGTNRKVKSWDKIKAIETLNKMLGYNAPEKKELDVNLTDAKIIFE